MSASVEAPPREGMVWIAGGTFRMGDERFYPEEQPVREVRVDGFWIDATPGDRRELPALRAGDRPRDDRRGRARRRGVSGRRPDLLVPGSLVFQPSRGPVPLDDHTRWWAYVPGACWQRPEGRGSDTYSARGTP